MIKKVFAIALVMMALFGATGALAPQHAFAKGGGTTGGTNFAGNWSGRINTPDGGTGGITFKTAQTQNILTGSVHFDKPVYEGTMKVNATALTPTDIRGYVSNGDAKFLMVATMSADGKTLSGTITQGQTFAFTATRK